MYISHAALKANIFLLNLNISPASNSFRHISKILFHKCCLYVCNYCEVFIGIHIKLPISQVSQFCYILTFSEVGTGRVCLLLPQEPSEVMMMVLMMIGAAAAYDNSDDDDGDKE